MRKAIKRATKESARKAMRAHVARMLEKNWILISEFEGFAGAKYECVSYFMKSK